MALSCAMAGPAAAMPAMKAAVAATLSARDALPEAAAEAAMPCHEAALADVAEQIAGEGGSFLVGKDKAPAGLHLCCVMATLVVTPLKPTLIAAPSPRFALLVPGVSEIKYGRIVKMPTPPPRYA